MKTTRFIAFGLLICVGFVLLISEPSDDSTTATFLAELVVTKGGAFACFAIASRLARRMEKTGDIKIEEE